MDELTSRREYSFRSFVLGIPSLTGGQVERGLAGMDYYQIEASKSFTDADKTSQLVLHVASSKFAFVEISTQG